MDPRSLVSVRGIKKFGITLPDHFPGSTPHFSYISGNTRWDDLVAPDQIFENLLEYDDLWRKRKIHVFACFYMFNLGQLLRTSNI